MYQQDVKPVRPLFAMMSSGITGGITGGASGSQSVRKEGTSGAVPSASAPAQASRSAGARSSTNSTIQNQAPDQERNLIVGPSVSSVAAPVDNVDMLANSLQHLDIHGTSDAESSNAVQPVSTEVSFREESRDEAEARVKTDSNQTELQMRIRLNWLQNLPVRVRLEMEERIANYSYFASIGKRSASVYRQAAYNVHVARNNYEAAKEAAKEEDATRKQTVDTKSCH